MTYTGTKTSHGEMTLTIKINSIWQTYQHISDQTNKQFEIIRDNLTKLAVTTTLTATNGSVSNFNHK